MVVRFEANRQTKVPMSKVLECFSHPENLPGVHPEFVKGVKIVSRESDITAFEQDASMLGRKIHSLN